MNGSVAIVTGGAGNLGRGVCRALTKAGATVVVVDKDISRAESAAAAIECDVTVPAACESAVAETIARFRHVDVLVNFAQQFTNRTLLETRDEDMLLAYASGPQASLRMMQLVHPSMKARGGGTIVNCASASGTMGGIEGHCAQAMAKEAIRGLTKHAAMEWAPDRIRVNVLCPVAGDAPNRFSSGVETRVPLGRIGDPETDVGATVVFLASGGSYITGRTLFIDGGIGTWR
jgi:NAD(P)-dependent dehydrogenase (short-subunit alcohol dehydrogenase family)